jgi:para-nitrobenzyl esterase
MQKKVLASMAAGALAVACAFLVVAPAGAEDGERSGHVTVTDGTSIHYTMAGSGPPLVFLHGWSCDRTYWREQLPAFAEDHTVVAIDLAGHGESSAKRETWTLEQLGDDVAVVVRELALERPILIGHSMGGAVALEAARRLGPNVAGIVSVDSLQNAELRYPPERIAELIDSYRRDFAGTCDGFVRSMFLPSADAKLVAWTVEDMCAAPPAVAVPLLEQFPKYDVGAAMKAVAAPIRSINAAMMPTALEINRKYAPGYDAIVLDGVGHFLQLEAGERFNAALRTTIESLRATRSQGASDDRGGAGAAAANANGAPIARTKLGRVRGATVDGIHAFKGLRYGAPPVGELRFRPPQPAAAWKDVADATRFGAPCIQMATGASANPTTELSKQLATVFTTSTEMKIASEDCLFLNVWTPGVGDGAKRPVMVWLHGGGFAYGSGSWPVYDGHNLAKKGDVVVVTVNHRLNVFGYLHLGALAGKRYAQSGNAGMLDLVTALEWVRDNAAAFGGDAGNVTIFGESGGGVKVSTLMAMPAARGLFHRAVVQSGPGLRGVERDAATQLATSVLDELDVAADDAQALAQVPAEKVLAAAFAATASAGPAGAMRLAPVVDGAVLPRHPFEPDAPRETADVPMLVGWNKDEMTLFNAAEPWFGRLTEEELPKRVADVAGGEEKGAALLGALRELRPGYSPTYLLSGAISASRMFLGSVVLAERKAAQGAAPAYVYELVWETPVGDGIFKSPHTLEIPFVFANVDKALPLTGAGPEAKTLERLMSDAWIAFARTGDPNTPELPDWPAYDATRRATMVFDTTPRVVDDPDGAIREALE